MKRKPKYKIGTLLRNKQSSAKSEFRLEQIMIVGSYTMMGQTTTHEGLVVENEVLMYNLMYLGDDGRRESQTARLIEDLIYHGKMEIASAPD